MTNLEIDEDMVTALLWEQHPELADLPLERTTAGWDNAMFRLGETLCVRLPRRSIAAPLVLNEQRWLPHVSSFVPLRVPVPQRLGRPGGKYPWHWSIVPWIDGTPADLAYPGSEDAEVLADFLRALHRQAPGGAPRNPFRGCALADRSAALAPRIARLQASTSLFGPVVRSLWEQSLAASIDVDATWIHGDLHPRNVLMHADRMSAVIDWGDMAAGDRATDLACLWMLLSRTDRRRALERYGPISAHTLARARGWAILFGILFVDTGLNGDARFMAIGERALRHVADDPQPLAC